MQKPTLALLFVALLAIVAGAILVPQLLSEPDAPMNTWNVDDEIEGAERNPENASAAPATGTIERTEAAAMPATAKIDEDPAERVATILRGRVVNKSQQPVANARVWLEFGRGNARNRRNRDRNRRIPDPVETDSEGRFAFQGQAFRNLRVSLQVRHQQHAPLLFDKNLGAIADSSMVGGERTAEVDLGDLVLNTGGLVRGRVTDLDGNGVPGAALALEPDFRNRMRWQRNRSELLPEIVADGGGFFTYENIAAGDYSVSAKAKRHTAGRSDRFQVEEGQTVELSEIRLGPGYELSGFVRSSRGEPIADADVTLQPSRRDTGEQGGRDRGGRGRGGARGRGRDFRTKTDERGQFFVEHLPGSELQVRVDAEGYLDLDQDGIDPQVGQVLNLTMDVGLRITGVVQRTDGSPVKEYSVRAFRIRGLPRPGDPEISIEELTTKMARGNLNEKDMEKARDQMRQLRRTMGETMRRGGRGGRGGGDRNGGSLGELESHPNGAFALEGLQEGIYEVQVQAPEFARFKSQELTVQMQAAAPMVRAVVDPGVYCAGVVVDRFGDPVAGAEVEIRAAERETAPAGGEQGGNGRGNMSRNMARMASQWMRQASGRSQRVEVTADDEGVFIIKNLVRGTYRLTASADGFTENRTEVFELQSDNTNFELQLQPLGSLIGTVSGVSAEELGEARVGAVVLPEDGGMPNMFGRGGRGGRGGRSNGFRTVEVQADGSYRIDDLTPGRYVVRSWIGSGQQLMRELGPKFFDGSLEANAIVNPGDETRFDMQLTRPQVGTLAGSVLHNGLSAKGFRVELRKQEEGGEQNNGGGGGGFMSRMRNFGRSFNGTVDANGQFTIKNVTAGTYTVRIRASRRGNTVLEDAVQIVADATSERSYVVQTGSLRGTLLCDDGSDPKELRGTATLLLNQTEVPAELNRSMRGSGNAMARLNDGAFTFDAVQPGSYLLVVSPRNRERTTQIVSIQGEQTIEVIAGKAVAATQPGGK